MLKIPHKTPCQGRRGFTLIELLVVITIIAIMLGVAAPSFIGMGKGNKMKTAISELRSTLALARQWAISHRETAYVVFPDWDAGLYSSDEDRRKALRGYAVYTKSDGYISEWKYLPQGLFFDPDATGGGGLNIFNAIGSGSNLTLYPDTIGFPDGDNIQPVMFALGFGSDGWLDLTKDSIFAISIHITEGWIDEVSLNHSYKPGRLAIVVTADERSSGLKVREYVPEN